jgi:hypothetical protein
MTDEDIRYIDQRSYFITIPLSHIDEIQRTQQAIYTKIRKSFGFRDNDTKIGLILCGDINGTRTNLVHELGYENPHCHGLIFIPKDIAPQDETAETAMVQNLKLSLAELVEISRQVAQGNEIYVRRYDPQIGSLFQTISYTIKADTNPIFGQGDKFSHSTFPYDKKLNSISRIINFDNPRTQELLFKLHLYPDQVFANANLNHLTEQQMDYRQRYEDAVGTEAKSKIKQRFLSLIRPTTNSSTGGLNQNR